MLALCEDVITAPLVHICVTSVFFFVLFIISLVKGRQVAERFE